MDIYEFCELLKKYALDNDNYKQWRKIHGEAFGDVFLSAFEGNDEAQICLTAALIKVSERNFEEAMPRLLMLEDVASEDFDSAAISYFIGLNYEFLASEAEMNSYYEKIADYDVAFLFNIAFHPYYRTAKFAQRDSECKKAVKYYRKAIDFYNETYLNSENAKILGQLNYDLATVYAYCHNYSEALKFMELSFKYDSAVNHQRNYVMAILSAVAGDREGVNTLLKSMPEFLRINCQSTAFAILNNEDLHYCVVSQSRDSYPDFWLSVIKDKEKLLCHINNGEFIKAESIISQLLTDTFTFMKRNIDCRIEKNGSEILVKCKNYCVKTLIEEYKALFSMKSKDSTDLRFISVEDFYIV